MHTSNQINAGWRAFYTTRFEQVCIYVSRLTQATLKETISVVKGKESHKGTCPVPFCHICAKQAGLKWVSGAANTYWQHTDYCVKGKMFGYIGNFDKKHIPLQIPGNYYPNMDHLELIEAQLTKEGMLAYDSIHETSIAAFQEMILYQRRAYFEALHDRYNVEALALELAEVNFCYPLMQMIATGQLFAPYFYHPDAQVQHRRAESRECLELLQSWIDQIDKRKLPKNMVMDWDGEWLSRDLIKNWVKDYEIPDVEPQLVPTHHPTKYIIQKNATRMILPAKGILPVGSSVGSPGFGLIHPTTISAAVLQDAGFQVDPENSYRPALFDAITLAPNFDFVCGRNRLSEFVNFITQWTLNEPQEDDIIAYTPPDGLSFDDFVNFQAGPIEQKRCVGWQWLYTGIRPSN